MPRDDLIACHECDLLQRNVAVAPCAAVRCATRGAAARRARDVRRRASGRRAARASAALPATSDLVVLLDVQRFDAKSGDGLDVDVVRIVRRAVDETSGRSGRSTVREPAGGAGYEALVGAFNRALARVSRDIGAVARAY